MPAKILGLPGSPNCMGPVMLGMETGTAELQAEFPQTDAMKKANPWGQMPAMVTNEDGTGFAETNAIMRYLAKKGGLAPADDETAATVDFCMDKFATGKAYTGFVQTIYPLFGYAKWTETPEENAKTLEAELELFMKTFYPVAGKFLKGAEKPTAADFRLAPFFFCWTHEKSLIASSGVATKDLAAFNAAFKAAIKPEVYGMLESAGGHALTELLEKATAFTPTVAGA